MALDPVLYRSAVVDPKTGGMTREWIRFFDQLSGGTFDHSIFFTQPNYIKFNNNAVDQNDGKIGNSMFATGLNIVGINNDFTSRKIQIWGGVTQNENPLGNTWLGKNTFSDPANLVFGSNYQTWSPIVSAAGSMVTSSVTMQEVKYVRVGPFVHFTLVIWCNLGGVASNTINITLPVAPVFSNGVSLTVVSTAFYLGGAGAETGFGSVQAGGLVITRSGGGNFPLVSGVQLYMSGMYRVV